MVKLEKIGGKQSKKFVENFKPNCLVVVTHPGCGHCVAMKPQLKKAYNDLENLYTGDSIIYDVHGDALEESKKSIHQLNSVNGFPTLLIVKDKESDPIMYEGDRSKEDIIKFMTDNLDVKLQKKVVKNLKKIKNQNHKNLEKCVRLRSCVKLKSKLFGLFIICKYTKYFLNKKLN